MKGIDEPRPEVQCIPLLLNGEALVAAAHHSLHELMGADLHPQTLNSSDYSASLLRDTTETQDASVIGNGPAPRLLFFALKCRVYFFWVGFLGRVCYRGCHKLVHVEQALISNCSRAP